MKTILLFISFLVFISCNPNESAVDSIGETATEGLSALNKKIGELEDKLSDKKKAYKRLQYEIEDNEDDLEETQDELEDIETQLSQRLTPAKRKELEDRKAELERKKIDLEGTISSLETQKTNLEGTISSLETQKTNLLAAIERESRRANRERSRAEDAETERECWKKTKDDFCDRNEKLRTVVIALVDGISDCDDINYCHLEDITELDLTGTFDASSSDPALNRCANHNQLNSLNKKDFLGFTKLERLTLKANCLTTIANSPGIFEYLISIKDINLQDAGVSNLPKSFFTTGNIASLENGKVWVNAGFLYCSGSQTPYKDKLSSEAKAYHHRRHSSYGPEANYCYD